MTKYKEMIIENATIVYTDFRGKKYFNGSFLGPTIGVKIDGRKARKGRKT